MINGLIVCVCRFIYDKYIYDNQKEKRERKREREWGGKEIFIFFLFFSSPLLKDSKPSNKLRK